MPERLHGKSWVAAFNLCGRGQVVTANAMASPTERQQVQRHGKRRRDAAMLESMSSLFGGFGNLFATAKVGSIAGTWHDALCEEKLSYEASGCCFGMCIRVGG